MRTFIMKLILKRMFDREDLRLVQSLFKSGILSGEDMKSFIQDYVSNDYRSDRLQMMSSLSRYCGYGTSIADIARFKKDHMNS